MKFKELISLRQYDNIDFYPLRALRRDLIQVYDLDKSNGYMVRCHVYQDHSVNGHETIKHYYNVKTYDEILELVNNPYNYSIEVFLNTIEKIIYNDLSLLNMEIPSDEISSTNSHTYLFKAITWNNDIEKMEKLKSYNENFKKDNIKYSLSTGLGSITFTSNDYNLYKLFKMNFNSDFYIKLNPECFYKIDPQTNMNHVIDNINCLITFFPDINDYEYPDSVGKSNDKIKINSM